MSKMIKSALMILFLSGLSFADDWQFDRVFYDYEQPRSDGYGIHGTVVAPDGNIWVAMHGPLSGDTLFVDDGAGGIDTVLVKSIHVFTPAGAHTAFSPILFAGGDTLTYSGKGMCLDPDGNIIYATNRLYRFNSVTGAMMNEIDVLFDETDPTSLSSLTQPSADQDGNIYVSWVAGKNRPIVKIDPAFTTQTSLCDSCGVNYNRSTLVSPNADNIFLGSTWTNHGIKRMDANLLKTAYELGNMVGTFEDTWTVASGDTTGTIAMWAEVLAWANNVLWAGGTDPDWYGSFNEGITAPHKYAGEWVGFDPKTGEVIDNFGIGEPMNPDSSAAYVSGRAAAGATCGPRGLGVSADGKTLYVGDFATNVIQVWTNANPVLAIEEKGDSPIVAMGYALDNAYPNPFNPTTTINYEIGRTGNAKLEIFNLVGQSMVTLIDGWHFNGEHKVVWDGNDSFGNAVPSGTYIYRLTSPQVSFSKRVTLVK